MKNQDKNVNNQTPSDNPWLCSKCDFMSGRCNKHKHQTPEDKDSKKSLLFKSPGDFNSENARNPGEKDFNLSSKIKPHLQHSGDMDSEDVKQSLKKFKIDCKKHLNEFSYEVVKDLLEKHIGGDLV